MARTWTPTDVFTTTKTGTNSSMTDVIVYDDNGYWGAGRTDCLLGTDQNTYGNLGTCVVRFTIVPTKKVKSFSVSLTHKAPGSGDPTYDTTRVQYYAKVSSSDSAWPVEGDHNGTLFDVSAPGTNTLTITLGTPTDETFYVYMWGYRIPKTPTSAGDFIMKITAIGNPSCAAAAPSVYVKVGGNWKQCDGVYVKVGGDWKEATEVDAKVSGNWKKADA